MRCLTKSWIGSRFRGSDICEGAAKIVGFFNKPLQVGSCQGQTRSHFKAGLPTEHENKNGDIEDNATLLFKRDLT